MAAVLTIIRLWTTSFFCLAGLGIILNSCLTPAVSFAGVLLPEHHPVVSPPATDSVLATDTKSDKPIAYSSLFPPGKDVCFWIEDRIDDPLSLREYDDKHLLLLPLTTACVGLLAAGDEIGWPGYEAQGDHARSIGNLPEAEKAYATAAGLLDRTADKEVNQDLASLLNKLGTTRFKQHDFAGAEMIFRRALTIYTLTRGHHDLRVADTLDLVASALFEQQQGRALTGPLFYRAWVVREEMLGPDHPAVADSLHHVAASLYADNLSLAIPLLFRSKEIREKIFGHDHPLVANSLNAMARLYEVHNHRDLAIPLYQDALTIQENVFGPNASETMQARSSLDMAHRGKAHLHEQPEGRE
ncbi:tetratricopeptide repeat protein [Nitrospira sp. BLG_2]|uniref:tetratricopeptide repeat protein n=1 Tax=Nitrospira sp. BLG_2 TaxID=3397507 RepID=UPI003B9D57EC